jgi:type IV secretory pathway protease TraF
VYVLNDNRSSRNLDSRDFGPLRADQIVGKVVIGSHW